MSLVYDSFLPSISTFACVFFCTFYLQSSSKENSDWCIIASVSSSVLFSRLPFVKVSKSRAKKSG